MITEREFYKQRSEAFSGKWLSAEEADVLFPEENELTSNPVIFCPGSKYASSILKMGWLLGPRVYAVTPHMSFHYVHSEVTGTHIYPETTSIDPQFIQWQDTIKEYIEEDRIQLIPSIMMKLSKTSDAFERWENIDINVSRSNFDGNLTLPAKKPHIESSSCIEIDIPQLIINDLALVKKVQSDYPVAAHELSRMLRDTHAKVLAKSPDKSETELLNEIKEDNILPGIEAIKHEYRAILRNNAINTATNVIAVTVPISISFATRTDELVTKLLASGIGLLVAKGLNQTRRELSDRRKTPYYAALKMELS